MLGLQQGATSVLGHGSVHTYSLNGSVHVMCCWGDNIHAATMSELADKADSS